MRLTLGFQNRTSSVILGLRRALSAVGAELALALALTALATPGASASEGDARPIVLDVRVRAGELTVDLRDAPLSRVLRTIGEKAGLEVTLRGDLTNPITDAFDGLALEAGIRRLARGASVAATYGPSPEDPARDVVVAIWIMGGSAVPGGSMVTVAGSVAGSSPSGRGAVVAERALDWSGERSRPDPGSVAEAVDPRVAGLTREIRTLAEGADGHDEAAAARLAEIGLSDDDATVRHQAVAALGRFRGVNAERALSEALADVDVAIRLRAVRGLRSAGTDTSTQSLARALTADADPRVRLAALTALTSLPGGTMLRGLAAASSDPDEAVRQAAIHGLSWWSMHLRGTR